ncbi:MAG: hypothetical protein KME42_13955 [Tildeniella nuda ZEHNDER 1965/U140]|jgi:hypothetical protein|nr:hypothetical protein [Tildeniella nuda ZEHNDER 1965/U140]
MPSVIPNRLSLDFLTAYLPGSTTIDAHLLTAAPAESATTGADLTVASGGNVSRQNFTLSSPSADGSGAKTVPSVTSLTWTGLYAGAATAITHIGFTKRIGGSYASSDPIIDAIELTTDTTIASTTTVSASPNISTTNSFSALSVGQTITGTGIPSETTILAIPTSTTIVLSKRATASGTVTVTVKTPNSYTPPTASGGADFAFTFPAYLLKIDDYL